MSRLARAAAGAFDCLWRGAGRPQVSIVAPLAAWPLPPGYSYQPETDTLTDAAGGRVTDLAAVWQALPVPALPARGGGRVYDPALGGIVETGRAAYLVPWAHRAALEAAWGVCDAQGLLWRVTGVTVDLDGAPVTAELERR